MKKFLSIVLAVVMILSMAACSERTPTETSNVTEQPTKIEGNTSEKVAESTEEVDKTKYRPSYALKMWDSFDEASDVNANPATGNDTAAWIYIPGCEWDPTKNDMTTLSDGAERTAKANKWAKVDDAVLQSTDNSYYERRDETGEYNIWGCYFADFRNVLNRGHEGLSSNTIIYGHSSYRDVPDYGPKFSQLFRYICDETGDTSKGLEFLKESPYIYLATGEDYMVFQIFSVFYTNINDFYFWCVPEVDMADYTVSDQKAMFADMISTAKLKSEYIIDLDVTTDDKILTLSTCTGQYNGHTYGVTGSGYENYRMVVMAKLLDTDEVPEVCPTNMKVNPAPVRSE